MRRAETVTSWTLRRTSPGGDIVLITPGGARLTLPAADHRATVWASALERAKGIGAPVYLAFDDQGLVFELIVEQRRVVQGMRSEPGAQADAVTFRMAPSIYHLMHDSTDYPRIHGLLSRARDTKEEIWVASLPGRAIIVDARADTEPGAR